MLRNKVQNQKKIDNKQIAIVELRVKHNYVWQNKSIGGTYMNTKDKSFIPFIVTLVSAILIFATIFMPFVTAKDAYEDLAAAFGKENISICEYSDVARDGSDDETAYNTFFIILTIFSLLTVLFTFLKKHIPTIIFSILSLIIYLLFVSFANEIDKIIGDYGKYEAGIAYYLLPIAIVITVVGSIYLMILKKKSKKNA